MADTVDGDVLRSIEAWLRFENTQRYLDVLRQELRDDKVFRAFAASDGSHSQREVAEQAGVSQPTVSRLWKRWSQLGIMISSGDRPSHLLAPGDVGVDGPFADAT